MYFAEGAASSEALRVGLFLRDQNQIRTMKPLFESNGFQVGSVHEVNQSGKPLATTDFTGIQDAEAVVIDLSSQQDSVRAAREALERCPVKTSVIVIGRENSLDHYRTMREIGVAEYYAHPVPAEELVRATRRLLRKEEATNLSQRLIAVHGVTGGSGSGLLSAGLSTLLSQVFGRSCVLVDADLATPTSGSWLGSDRPGSLSVLVMESDRIDKVLVEQAVQSPLPKLALLDGYEGIDGIKTSTPATYQRLLTLLGEQYRYQIWRGTGGSGQLASYTLDTASTIVLVLSGTFPAVREARQIQERLATKNAGARIITVYNMTQPKPVVPQEAMEKVLGRTIDYTIGYQKNLSEQLLRGVAFNDKKHCLYPVLSAITSDILGVVQAKAPWWKRVLK